MQNNQATITILPHKRTILATRGTTLLEALIHKSIFLRTDCGGKGVCGKCLVEVIGPDNSVEPVLSCSHRIESDLCIRIPETSMLSSHIMSKAQIFFPESFNEKFKHSQGPDTFGIAVDLGTTTIAVYLCNMAKGEVISSLAVKNPQAIYGDDVMSRIGVIDQDPDNLKKLQGLVVKSIEWGAGQLISKEKDPSITISGMAVVGNPTMIHILAGVNPTSIGIAPYQPAFHESRQFDSASLGFESLNCELQILPQVSGFLGGDILAAAIAVDLDNLAPGTLLVDLGTNGELILKGHDRLFATSCATGPAFEGASLACGMQAIPGSINSVSIGPDQKVKELTTIQAEKGPGVPASGICGAGVLQAAAQLCEHGIIKPAGQFTNEEKEYVLVPEDHSAGQSRIYISQKDIRSIQLGKSALISGIEFLCDRAGFDIPKSILIAGAFGSHLSKEVLLRLGILPDMEISKLITMGNAAGSGAVMVLCDPAYVGLAQKMADKIEVVSLETNMAFQERFIENLSFPDPE